MPGELSPTPKSLAGGIKTFSCPSCGGSVGIRALGSTVTAVCQSCGSLIDVANDNIRIITAAAIKIKESHIPLGARGLLMGVDWEVLGYCIRTDDTGQYSWREYLLFNPYQGYRFLMEADGHWSFVKILRRNVAQNDGLNTIVFEENEYRVFLRGGAVVSYVMGEFYWRVKVGEKTRVADFIAPPFVLSMEQSNEDIIWSQGVYLDSKIVQLAFQLKNMPIQTGIAPNQPSPFKGNSITTAVCIALILLFIMQLIAVERAGNQTIYEREAQIPAIYKGQLAIVDPIEVPSNTGNLEIRAYSPVANNWVELDMTLANDATQENDSFRLPIEYYAGRDSDGVWSEGSQSNYQILSSIHAGKYHLQVEPDAGAFATGLPVDIKIQIIRDVPIWSNFLVIACLLIFYPLIRAIRSWRFETRRWANSDCAPMLYRKSEDNS